MTHRTNDHGKVLIENWVEERACESYDNEISAPVVNRSGHTGIISTNAPDGTDLSTTVRDTFRPPSGSKIRQKGTRKTLLEDSVYKQVAAEVAEECRPQQITPDYQTTMHKDYDRQFNSDWPEPVTHHNLLKELPMSYWTDGVAKGIHGVTQVRCDGSPFKKNSAFSTPTEIYMDQPKPYEDSHLVSQPVSRYC